jgi:DegV family protein with EDD domain
MDSQLISLGLRELVISAARASQEGASLEEVVKLIRGMIPHIYIVVIGASLDYLEHGGRLSRAEAFLSGMLGVKPILILEDGEFIPMEKARGRVRAFERLYEFVTEFPRIDKLSVMQSSSNRGVDELVERISVTLPDLKVTRALYGPSLASIVGPDAQALIVYEGM